MNDEEEFSDCLESIGFEAARDFVENAGLSTVDELLELGPRQLTALFPHAARYKPRRWGRTGECAVYLGSQVAGPQGVGRIPELQGASCPPPLILRMK